MMASSEASSEEDEPRTPTLLRNGTRFDVESCTTAVLVEATPSSVMSSVVFRPISEKVLKIWSTLPEMVRLDPSLMAIQQEYERVSFDIERPPPSNMQTAEYLVVDMSVDRSSTKKTTDENSAIEKDNLARLHDHDRNKRRFYRYTKLFVLTCCWIIFTIILMTESENTAAMKKISIPSNQMTNYAFAQDSTSNRLAVTLESSLLLPPDLPLKRNFSSTHHLNVWLGFIDELHNNKSNDSCAGAGYQQNSSEPWIISVLSPYLIGVFSNQRHEKMFNLTKLRSSCEDGTRKTLAVYFETDLPSSLSISIGHDFWPVEFENRIVYAVLILIGLYILIIFEIVHRTLAAMLASTMSLAILASVNERPTMTELLSWIDVDTLLLLFSMMILVSSFAQTGVFDYLAVYAYKITGGKVWPLINTICFSTAFMASLLDNVTVVLLMTPITIRLCKVMKLNPVPILTAMLSYSNIGGAATPVGDPPNVIISSNRDVIAAGIDFTTFSMHMGVGVIAVVIIISVQLRYNFRDVGILGEFDEPQDIRELRHEIAIWHRAATSLSIYSEDENFVRKRLTKKVNRLESLLRKKLTTGPVTFHYTISKYNSTLKQLQQKYPIRDQWMLVKSSIALLFVMTLFFLNNVPNLDLSLGWKALLGVLLLFVIADAENIDGLLARIEWSTLLFFASLSVLMEGLARLGLIRWIGRLTEDVILSVHEESRLAVAILLILWVSAFASAFVDNVPLVQVMIRIAISLAKNTELGLPLQPLIWALTFGACMGGNATLIGATANVVCAGIAEQHGYRLTFLKFFRFGFPIMLTSTATITVYLMIAHVVFDWM